MIDFDFLERLIRTIDESSIDAVEIERGGTRIRLSKTPPVTAVSQIPAPVAASAPATAAPVPQPASALSPAPTSAGETPAAAPATNPGWIEITSPMVGTFYRSPSPESPAFVDRGTPVRVGETLCIIEAMKLMNELEAEVDGTIREILVENGAPVEYGQLLFVVEPA